MHLHEIRPFKADHLWGLKGVVNFGRLMKEARTVYESHPGWSGFCDGKLIASIGIIVPYPGLGEAWAVITPLGHQHALWLHRHVKSGILSLSEALKLRRLQATVKANFPEGRRWAESLGFVAEAILEGWGPDGSDYVMYKRMMTWPT